LYQRASAARDDLERAGISSEEARRDAEFLARHVLGWDNATWLARRHEELPAAFDARYAKVVARRAEREPVAYIRGIQEFYGREFVVSPAVLIPRPETELLIDEALLLLPALGFSRPLTVVDIGTGSGCLAVTLALEYPRARYIATDTSDAALAVARDNAVRLGAGDRVEFIRGAYLADAPAPINVIVTNPPYVAHADRDTLAPELLRYEPEMALFGGDDGLRDIREILKQADDRLDDDGSLLMEIGYGQEEPIAELADASTSLAMVRSRRDLHGIARVAVIRRCR
jgi:release factor glutamine methyltransferase